MYCTVFFYKTEKQMGGRGVVFSLSAPFCDGYVCVGKPR